MAGPYYVHQQRSILIADNGSYKICYDRISMESFTDINENEMEKLNILDKLFDFFLAKLQLQHWRQGIIAAITTPLLAWVPPEEL